MIPNGDLNKTREQLLAERRTAEQAQRDALAQLRGVINTAVDGILAIDERGLIQWLNPAAQAIFGYREDELIGHNVSMLMPEPDHSRHDQYLANYLRTGQAKIIGIGREVQGRRKDGTVFPLYLAISEVKLGDRRLFTGIVRDITQRKQVERELLAAKEEAVAASLAKDQFLAVVSHELRTPLTPILAAVSFLEDRPNLPEEMREEIITIRRNVEHEAKLVDDLLNLTRLGRGKIELHHEAVDAHGLLRSLLPQFQSEIDLKDLEVSVALRARQHYVWADPTRLRQVLINLLDNATKFCNSGGRITLRTANTPEGRFEVEISDTGIGMEPEMLARLFNPFEQGERTIARKYGGMGLGLAISKGIVDLHGGKLTAHSQGRDQGATFRLELGVVPAVHQVSSNVPAVDAEHGGVRVLLVEDHQDTLRIMTKLLRAMGYRVIPATTVREALQLDEQEAFEVMVSDIGLPDGTGLELMRQLASRHQVKAIAVSGFGQEEDRRRSKQAGFLEHLTKPVDFRLLQSVLKQVAS